jgi:hypothetical protein
MSDSNDRTDEEASNSNHEEDLPCSKKLRYIDPDIEIIVRTSSHEEKRYHMYSAVLGSLSKFMDASLSVRATRQIVFQQVSPATFEAAIRFLRDPVASRSMTPRDVLQVIEFYNRYEFEGGLQLCNQVLLDYFTQQDDGPPRDLDLLVDAVAVAERFALEGSRLQGVACLNSILQLPCHSRFGPMVFRASHIAKLQPLFSTGRFDSILHRMQLTPDSPEVSSPLFPRFFVDWTCKSNLEHCFANTYTVFLCLSGTTTRPHRYTCEFTVSVTTTTTDPRVRYEATGLLEGLGEIDFHIEKSTEKNGDWIIRGDYAPPAPYSFGILWHSPCSHNLLLPPKDPWIPVHDDVKNITPPTIAYHAE